MFLVMLRMIAVLVIAGSAAACALTEDKVPIDFVPASTPTPVAGAQSVTLSFAAVDKRRQYNDRISTKKNGYGMEMARILAANDVVNLVRTSLEEEFKALGFAVGPGGDPVTIELQTFYNDFKLSLFSTTAVAEVTFGLKVRDVTGTLIYAQSYTGTGQIANIFLASGENAKEALQKALANVVKQVVDDEALQHALVSKSKPPGPAARRV